MTKGIDQIRKSIAQRKKARLTVDRQRITPPPMPQDEEKHGFFPAFPEVSKKDKQTTTILNDLLIKACLSACLFLGAVILFQTNNQLLDKPKQWAHNALAEEFPFARIHHWYKETLGAPLAFSPTPAREEDAVEPVALPVQGHIEEEFQANGSGIMIAPDAATSVTAWNSGVIVFAGNDRKTDKTVIVQHPNGSQSTYALLSSIDVHLYQAVSAGQQIGTFNPNEANDVVYFSLKKDNEYMDPVKVIQVDADEAS